VVCTVMNAMETFNGTNINLYGQRSQHRASKDSKEEEEEKAFMCNLIDCKIEYIFISLECHLNE
jgi:hypothetical protein